MTHPLSAASQRLTRRLQPATAQSAQRYNWIHHRRGVSRPQGDGRWLALGRRCHGHEASWSLSEVLENGPTLHDEHDPSKGSNVLERIAIHRNDIGLQSSLRGGPLEPDAEYLQVNFTTSRYEAYRAALPDLSDETEEERWEREDQESEEFGLDATYGIAMRDDPHIREMHEENQRHIGQLAR